MLCLFVGGMIAYRRRRGGRIRRTRSQSAIPEMEMTSSRSRRYISELGGVEVDRTTGRAEIDSGGIVRNEQGGGRMGLSRVEGGGK